jgi:hypothetical protein
MKTSIYINSGYGLVSGIDETGGVMFTPLNLENSPVFDYEISNKKYMDNKIGELFTNGILIFPKLKGELYSKPNELNYLVLSPVNINTGVHNRVTISSKGRVIGAEMLSTSNINNLSWTNIVNKPDTLEGYDIIEGVSKDTFLEGYVSIINPPHTYKSIVNKGYMHNKYNETINNTVKIGDVIISTNPGQLDGYLRCNGAQVNISDYSNLYEVISGQFIQENEDEYAPSPTYTTFYLPDTSNTDLPNTYSYIK